MPEDRKKQAAAAQATRLRKSQLKLDQFLCWSCSGGTDVDEPLARNLETCSTEADCNTRDVAILGDGGFNISDETVRMVVRQRCSESDRRRGAAICLTGRYLATKWEKSLMVMR